MEWDLSFWCLKMMHSPRLLERPVNVSLVHWLFFFTLRVHVCTCSCMWTRTHRCHHVHVEVKEHPWPLSASLKQCLRWLLHLPGKLSEASRGFLLVTSHLLIARLPLHIVAPGFLNCMSGDSNQGYHACAARTLPTEPPHQSGSAFLLRTFQHKS